MTDGLVSLGQELRSKREERRLTVEEMSRTTRIHSRYIQAMEEERWGELPAKVYLYGFLQKYAAALGLNPQDVLRIYRERHEVSLPVEPVVSRVASGPSVPSSRSTEASRLPDVTFLVVLTVLLTVLGVFHSKRIDGTSVSHAKRTGATMTTRPNEYLSTEAAEIQNSLEMRTNTPLRARVVMKNRVVFEGALIAGTRRKWPIEGLATIEAESGSLDVSSGGSRLAPRGQHGVWMWRTE